MAGFTEVPGGSFKSESVELLAKDPTGIGWAGWLADVGWLQCVLVMRGQIGMKLHNREDYISDVIVCAAQSGAALLCNRGIHCKKIHVDSLGERIHRRRIVNLITKHLFCTGIPRQTAPERLCREHEIGEIQPLLYTQIRDMS